MIDIKDVVVGESYACRFRINDYESIGILTTRDLDQKLVKLTDTQTNMEFVVPFDNIWDIDTIDWQGRDEQTKEES